jgi:hypothetical protein
MAAHDPDERTIISTIAAHERWAKCDDPSAATAPARQGLAESFERQVDPNNLLPPAERSRRAEAARKAYFTRLALKSHQARRARRLAEQLEAEVENALVAAGRDAA